MELADPVLEKVYHLNAERMFQQYKGAMESKKGTR